MRGTFFFFFFVALVLELTEALLLLTPLLSVELPATVVEGLRSALLLAGDFGGSAEETLPALDVVEFDFNPVVEAFFGCVVAADDEAPPVDLTLLPELLVVFVVVRLAFFAAARLERGMRRSDVFACVCCRGFFLGESTHGSLRPREGIRCDKDYTRRLHLPTPLFFKKVRTAPPKTPPALRSCFTPSSVQELR